MSASEKLKALDEKLTDLTLFSPMGSAVAEVTLKDASAEMYVKLRSALPQIVAVVEAAEEHQAAARAHWINLGNEGQPLPLREYAITAAAISALEEALA